MSIKFNPHFTITIRIASYLTRIETSKEKVLHLPITPSVLASLRETARLYTTHYSTMIEGNRLEPEQIQQVLSNKEYYTGREREEDEVKGYYAALKQIEEWSIKKTPITESLIQKLHALVMSGGRTKIKATPYRDGQNAIRDSRTKNLVYMPPEAKDVSMLMKEMVHWVSTNKELPPPIKAAIIHYQFATIHPYYDGNGRTARLLTTLVLHLGGYDLKGLYSLEEYYARNLGAYYDAISVGPSHNYYRGRAESDITPWIEYFLEGMAIAFESVMKQMKTAKKKGAKDQSDLLLRKLDPKQRKVLDLFQAFETITAKQIGDCLGVKPRTSAKLCQDWVRVGFLTIADFSNKARKYRLAKKFSDLLQEK